MMAVWMPFVYNEANYLLKIIDESAFKLFLTDLKSIWVQELNRDNVISNFKEQNPLYNEENSDKIFEDILKVIKNVEAISSLENVGVEIALNFKIKIEDLPVKINFLLTKADSEFYFQEVTIPLIKTVQFLELKEKKHSELLIKKDKEIQEYNFQFGTINRKNAITEKYVKETSNGSDLVLNVFTKSDLFYETLTKKHGDIQKVYPNLKEFQPKRRKLKLPKKRI